MHAGEKFIEHGWYECWELSYCAGGTFHVPSIVIAQNLSYLYYKEDIPLLHSFSPKFNAFSLLRFLLFLRDFFLPLFQTPFIPISPFHNSFQLHVFHFQFTLSTFHSSVISAIYGEPAEKCGLKHCDAIQLFISLDGTQL